MKIDEETVARIAVLARLEPTPEQIGKFARQFQDIIGYMDGLNTVDTAQVEPMYSPSENMSVMREDVCRKDHERKDILANAPRHDEQYFIVPRII